MPALQNITNATLWDECRKLSPTFASHTAKATKDLFTQKGFEALTRSGLNVINEFFELSLRVGFQKLQSSKAVNPLAEIGLVQIYDTPNGGFVQRIAVNSIKPVSPAYKGLEDYAKGGSSVDPYIVRKPESSERFFQMNFDYQSFITVQDYQVKTIFISETGMGAFVAGIMEGLRNGYTIQEYENTLECLNAALNSQTYPLQGTQKVQLDSWTPGAPAATDLMSFIKNVKDITTAMKIAPQTSAFNAGKFATRVETEDLVLLVRAGIKTAIDLQLEVGAFNPDRLSLPYEVHEVEDFGGLVPKDASDNTLIEAYNSIGESVGYVASGTTGVATWDATNSVWKIGNVTVAAEPDHWDDPNEDVLAVLIQKGAIFENSQNPYIVKAIENPRGLYMNYWASRPNNGLNYDHYYTLIAFLAP